MFRINKTLIYFLILTMIGSALAMKIIFTAYESAYADYLIQ
jgi:uncharacterized membrane protein